MDPHVLKNLVKEGRACAKKKDWNGTLGAAKTVLRYEPNNYMALILEGVALSELGKQTQGLESYRKASKINPTDLHCWQGIITFYEKSRDLKHKELAKAYERIAELYKGESNLEKYRETVLKYAGVLLSQGGFSECIRILQSCIKSCGHAEKVDQMVVQVVGQFKEPCSKVEEELHVSCLYELHDSNTLTDENYKKLLQLLYKNNQFKELSTICFDLKPRFNTFYNPIEYLCRLYIENQLTIDPVEMKILSDKVLKLYPSSTFGYFAKGKYYQAEERHVEAIGWLKEGIESRFHESAVTCLIQSLLFIWDFPSAEEYCHLAMKKAKDPSVYVEFFCMSLAGQEKWSELKLHMGKLGDSKLVRIMNAEILANEENWEEFDAVVKELGDCWEAHYFDCFKSEEKLEELCRTNSKNLECLLKCGKRLNKLGNVDGAGWAFEQCLRLSQNHPIALFHLGVLCKLNQDFEGAKKCLAKAYEFLPTCETGSCLSDLYFELYDLESNKDLLVNVTKNSKKAESKWAWLRLGVLHLHLGEATEAVVALQSAIRTDIKDCNIWETLADAYYARGSYEAALKAYNQCIKLGADPVYPSLRIGVINGHLGLETLAIQALNGLGDYVPALVELAKIWMTVVQKRVVEGLDASAVEAVEEGLGMAARALKIDIKQQILPLVLVSHLVLSACRLNPQSEFKVPSYLVSPDNTLSLVELVNLKSLILIGIRVAVTALAKSPSKTLTSSLHSDLAKLYYYLSTKCNMNCIQKAIYHGKKSISLAPVDPAAWNCLCVVAFAAHNIKLAQHCCVKSIQLNNAGNPTAWCNLGFLYLSVGQHIKAHRCFVEAQSSEPGYGRTWIGMGLVAEQLLPLEAMDLFRHSFTIPSSHEFATFAYSEWLCKCLQDEYKLKAYDYKSSYFEAVNVAHDHIWLFNVRSPNAASLNAEGILQLHAHLDHSAIKSFRKARDNTNDPLEVKIINQNLIIALSKAREYADVLKAVELNEPSFIGLVTAAFASDRLGHPSDAFEFYEKALSLSSSPIETSDTLVGQGMSAVKIGNHEEAKTLLFKGCTTKHPNSEGYLALCSLGLLTGEVDLATGVLMEMSLKCRNEGNIHDIALMEACCLIQFPAPAPLRSILSKIHQYPSNGKLRKVLASHLMNFHADGVTARKGLINASVYGEKNELAAVAFTYLMEGDYENALRYSKSSLVKNLGDAASYAVMAASLGARGTATNSTSDRQLSLRIRNIALATGRCAEFPRIEEWFRSYAVA